METVERVQEVVEPLVRARRCSLYDLEVFGRGATKVLRVFVDRPNGIDTDTLETVSKLVSRALDDADVISGRYTLEVSSPGLERALRRPEHFAASAGMTARVKLKDGTVLEGPLCDVGDTMFRVGDTEVAYDSVGSARTVFEWGPAEKKKGAQR